MVTFLGLCVLGLVTAVLLRRVLHQKKRIRELRRALAAQSDLIGRSMRR